MKRKFVKISFVVAIAMIGGINVFNSQKSIELSDIALANVEALAQTENPNCTISGRCLKSSVLITDCHVKCWNCGAIWYPEQRNPMHEAWDVSGKCGVCGNTSWDNYN